MLVILKPGAYGYCEVLGYTADVFWYALETDSGLIQSWVAHEILLRPLHVQVQQVNMILTLGFLSVVKYKVRLQSMLDC